MIRSGRGTRLPGPSALNPSMAARTWTEAASPCTTTGHTITWHGHRSRIRCRMSRITAPVGLVITPMVAGIDGRRRLREGSNSPSACSLAFSRSSCASKAPTPAGSMVSMTIWYLDEAG